MVKKIKKIEKEIKSNYIAKLQKIRKGRYFKFNSIEDLRKATTLIRFYLQTYLNHPLLF